MIITNSVRHLIFSEVLAFFLFALIINVKILFILYFLIRVAQATNGILFYFKDALHHCFFTLFISLLLFLFMPGIIGLCPINPDDALLSASLELSFIHEIR